MQKSQEWTKEEDDDDIDEKIDESYPRKVNRFVAISCIATYCIFASIFLLFVTIQRDFLWHQQ